MKATESIKKKGANESLKPEQGSDKAQRPAKSGLRENFEAIVVAIILALFIRTFVVQAFKIPSGSMKETLQIGDHILVNKFIYGIRIPFSGKVLIPISEPERGDIIVFRFPLDPHKDFIKRVIGVEGDEVEIRDKQVYVNGKRLEQDFAIYTDPHVFPGLKNAGNKRDNYGPVTVPENALFVMGDNRDNSHDSRFWGFVKLRAVKGRAFMIYWSWEKEAFDGGTDWLTWWEFVRWGRIGNFLQ